MRSRGKKQAEAGILENSILWEGVDSQGKLKDKLGRWAVLEGMPASLEKAQFSD